MTLQSMNPATGQVLESFEETTDSELEQVLQRSFSAFHDWRRRPFRERGDRMREAARLLREGKPLYARTMALEMGKPIVQGEAEIDKCAWVCEFYADHTESFLTPEPRQTDAARSYVRFDPLGPILAIMPWNFPFWQVFRFASTALMAGNAGILKHASNVPRCALQIEEIFRQAGFPDHLFQTVLIGADRVGALIADPRITAATLTGSDRAGSRVAERAGRELKKTVLELGGSDPFIVLEDANLESAAKIAAEARLINSGQSCIAAKRFIVSEQVGDRFLELFVAEMRSRRVGDPLDRSTDVGPQARPDLRADLHSQVERSLKRGAELLLGGRVPDGPGTFYPPTVLVAGTPQMPAFNEETFGPVAAVIRARDEREAIALANDSQFGLGASLWTSPERAERLVPEIEAGSVFVNAQVKSDPRLPFGGIKRSGYGRELSEFGIREFVNIKTVWIETPRAPAVQMPKAE